MSSKKTPQPSISDPVTEYAKSVVDGEIIAGPHVRNSCRRHLDDLINGPARGLKWDIDAALRFIGFCRDVLRLNGGQFEGKPFILHPSQAFIVGSIFGWKRLNENGKWVRRFRRAYVEQAKGQGKSPLAGAIGLYAMMADGESGAEIYAAGKDKAQAMVLFRDSVAMYQQSPALKEKITPSGGNPIWNLSYLKTRSFFRPISKDGAHSGPRPYVALVDELHEHPDGHTIEMLERGFKFRDQPLLLMITNSGSDRNSVCWAEHVHAVNVAAGTQTVDEDYTYVGDVFGSSDEAFSYVCSLDKNDDPFTDPSCWVKVNPLLGVTLKYEYIEGVVAQARDIPSKRNNILRLHFCVWTESDIAWLPRPLIEKVMATFDPWVEHKGKLICAAGLDLSGTKDLTAAAFVVETGVKTVRKADGSVADLPTYDAWIEAWTPAETMDERSKVDHTPYRLWAESFHLDAAGEITGHPYLNAIEGARVRYDHVAAHFARLDAHFGISLLAYDRYAYDDFQDELDTYGLAFPAVAHPQGGKKRAKPSEEKVAEAKELGLPTPLGLWMPGSVGKLEELILEGRIRLRSSPVLLTALMGVAIETDPLMGNQWFSKKKATVRIDPAVALAMAVGAAVEGAVQEEAFDVSAWIRVAA